MTAPAVNHAPTKPDVLLLAKVEPYIVACLEQDFTVHSFPDRALPGQVPDEILAKVRAIATRASVGVTPAMIDACPSLEFISVFGAGVDRVPVQYAQDRAIPVGHTPDVLTEDVANMAILLLLATTRNLVTNDQYIRAGRWVAGPPPIARGLHGRTVGIVGYGRIGARIAEKLSVFSCNIAYHARHARVEAPHVFYADVLAMARDSDALIVALPGGAETTNMISLNIMRALGPEGILVNLGRGNCIDEAALVTALSDRSLGGAGLDVFAEEPFVPAALLGMPNVVLQPHQGSATQETRRRMADLFTANLVAHFSGGSPIVAGKNS